MWQGGNGVDGWHPDPYGIHEERLFANGEPTPLVRNHGIGSFDAPPVPESRPPRQNKTRARGPDAGPGPTRPTKPMVALATLLIAAGLSVGVVGITRIGGSGGGAATTTTVSPLVSAFRHLPPLTTLIPPAAPTTTGAPASALQALPPSTAPPVTTPPTTRPPSISTTSRPPAPRVTQPPKHAPAVSSIVATTTLPLTTMTTSVGQADQAWYLAYGSAFNTLQTDIEKLDRALASTAPSLYADIHPYWQELSVDANYALSLPPIPDAGTQSQWATALADLTQGAVKCVLGSIGSPAERGIHAHDLQSGCGAHHHRDDGVRRSRDFNRELGRRDLGSGS